MAAYEPCRCFPGVRCRPPGDLATEQSVGTAYDWGNALRWARVVDNSTVVWCSLVGIKHAEPLNYQPWMKAKIIVFEKG